jgi:DNA processing protein
MDQVTFLLYILSQSISSVRPEMVIRLREWYEQFSCEQSGQFSTAIFCQELELSKEQAAKFTTLFYNTDPARFTDTLASYKINAVNLFQPSFPSLLLNIPDPPLVLYYRGNISVLENIAAVAIVGSRRATKYGELVVQKIIAGLAQAPVAIVSGLAFGIDAASHKAALEHNLPTIAVLGSSIDNDNVYPRDNFHLAQEILENNGALISEYPPPTEARKYQFVARNRIIAGLAHASIIAEAAKKSGALITADFAMEYNRSVFAIPGSILSPTSYGPHHLISQGAALLQSSAELLTELGLAEPEAAPSHRHTTTTLTPTETRVLEYMQHEPIELEELIALTNLPISELQATLTALELKRLVKQTSPQIFQKL